MPPTDHRPDPDTPVSFPPLVYLVEGDEVTIGRPDIDSFGIFPPEGAAVVRRLEAGDTPRQVAGWYAREYGETIDIEHMLSALAELDLIRSADTPAVVPPVRWQRLGGALFSAPAWLIYALAVGWAVVAMVRSPDLVPDYRHVFFTEYYTVIELGLFLGTIPLLLLHESFHALAGRRLGVRSRLRVSHRLYYVVLETSLDGLVAVPRRRRILPILAGLLADVLVLAILTITADLTREAGGQLSFLGRVCLAIAFVVVLRIAWQFFFYLRTDLYALISTVLGCVDLHATARRLLGYRVRSSLDRLVGRRPGPPPDEADWHPIDRRAARWYSWLILVGYTVSIATLLAAALPVAYRMIAGAVGRLTGPGASWDGLLDSFAFLTLTLGQVLFAVWLAARERRQRNLSKPQHILT